MMTNIDTLQRGVIYMMLTEVEILRGVIAIILIALFLIALAYTLARVASLGWYQSKAEHFKRIWEATKEDEKNGNEEV